MDIEPNRSWDAFIEKLVHDNQTTAPRPLRGLSDGPALQRQLKQRLNSIIARASELPAAARVQLVGLDWLDENQHIIREAVDQVGGNLPRGYARKLPLVVTGDGTTAWRVSAIADAMVDFGDLPVDIPWIERFLAAYQLRSPLTLGELWALPTIMRVIVVTRLCDSLISGIESAVDSAAEEQIAKSAANTSGAILSLRTLAATDWLSFVERLSVVERILANDPSGDYSKMDARSRNRYRERIERLARRHAVTEQHAAATAVALAGKMPGKPGATERHVGCFIVGDCSGLLETALSGKTALRTRLAKHAHTLKSWTYLLLIGTSTALSLELLDLLLSQHGAGPAGRWILLGFGVIPVLAIWTEIVNWLVTQVIPPRILPKLDFSRGIPETFKSVVVVPCMLTTDAEITRLAGMLEINYLGNDDRHLRFVLLSDHVDADREVLEPDQSLLDHACNEIDALNARYGTPGRQPFALLHRRRLWNARAECWMGWERKRGKLDEFNRWLLGAEDTSFTSMHGDVASLRGSRFVITLDADNQLLPGAAHELTGTLAHPLNRPRFDDTTGRVVAGYTVIQPRIDIHPASANRTPYSRLMSDGNGIDLYHAAVSETYQDLFGQGIYAGKGIYDVRAFTRCLRGRVPPNTILSHDLLEGVLGRAALATDIVLLENASPNLIAELRRQHRWIRGDWQLIPWLIPMRSNKATSRIVDVLGRWKLFDNLRRSLVPIALLLLYPLGWIIIPDYGLAWTLSIASVPALRIVYSLLGDLRWSSFRWGTYRSSIYRIASGTARQIAQYVVNLVTLPISAATSFDAIARTLARVIVTQQKMLEWTPAAQSEQAASGAGLKDSYMYGIAAPVSGVIAIVVAALSGQNSVLPYVLGASWCAAPLLVWLMAQERRKPEPLSAAGATQLRLVARRTWQFYERFVGPETHWLPPDNYQEAPKASVAERTSPTNIGLFLVSAIAVYDLGYLGAGALLTRIDGTTATMQRMRRFRGHLFNWYDTRDLAVLAPEYVSAVDSGNLVAALLICRTALDEIEQTPLPHIRAPGALRDIVANIRDIVAHVTTGESDAETTIFDVLGEIDELLESTPGNPAAWLTTVARIRESMCAELERAALSIAERQGPSWSSAGIESLRSWVIQLRNDADALRAELTSVQSLLGPGSQAEPGEAQPLPPRTLHELINHPGVDIEVANGAYGSHAMAEEEAGAYKRAADEIRQLLALRDRVADRIKDFIENTDFGFLFDTNRKLFHIGYNNTTGELDSSYYDLLASEARIASLVAIAKGDVPVSHWIHLGRPLRRLGGMRAILSWSATAFEYLMPRLFMESPAHGLLDASCRAVIRQQRRLSRRNRLPWGISESAYAEVDATGNYKYYAFGIDTLAIRKTTRQRYVVSPYSSMLALPFKPEAVIDNLRRLREFGCWGRFGLYDALDFGEEFDTTSKPRVVQTFMAHHQAMILAAIANAVCGDSLVARFHANPEIGAVEHLLHEALPKRAQDRIIRRTPPVRSRDVPVITAEHVEISAALLPNFINVVGNGHVTVRTTGSGGGDVRWNERAISRWHPRTDGPRGGDRIYLSEPDSGSIHVIGIPGPDSRAAPEVWSSPHQTEIHQHFGPLFARLCVGVMPDNDVVYKRVTITNESTTRRSVSLTHYAEIVLAGTAEDQRHPAFNKLFIESEFHEAERVLLFKRRRRSAEEPGLCCAVGAIVAEEFKPELRFEADRRAFIGRAGSIDRPAFLTDAETPRDPEVRFSLDPIASIATVLDVPAGATAQVYFLTAVSPDRAQALGLIDHFRSFERLNFSLDQARRRAGAELTELSIDSGQVERLLRIYASMVWPKSFSASSRRNLKLNRSILDTLWSRGISGDFPLCIIYTRQVSDGDLAARLLVLQSYLGRRGIPIDIILADESPASYAEPVRSRLEELVHKYRRPGNRGKTFIVAINTLSPEERAAIDAAALVRFDADGIQREGFRDRRHVLARGLPDFVPTRPDDTKDRVEPDVQTDIELEFDNGYGGVDASTGDYVVRCTDAAPTPAPWINVLANPDFGSIISERGAATTWFGNSSEQRVTPWYNDPVRDRAGEALYLRDEETGKFWSPMPWPVPGGQAYRARHGAGFSRFDHSSHELDQRVDCFVDKRHAFKCMRIRLRNTSDRARRVTATCFVEWVLGNHYEDTSPYLFPEINDDRNVLLCRNALPRFTHDQFTFLTATESLHGYTTDRREFLGDARDPSRPVALERIGLSGEIVAGGEPCAAYQVHVDLAAGQETEVAFVIGAARGREAALQLASECRSRDFLDARYAETLDYWRDLLGRCRIRTPNRALDVLFNRWLLYQNLACRLWGRSGLYQAAGGFGFRDQLQDSLALVHLMPDLTRAQILKACSAQFPEGDVLHWWHDEPIRGVRSRCSDDLLWLPYCVSEYLQTTGDKTLLEEEVAFLVAEPLRADELERYTEYSQGNEHASVYEHCNRAIDARAATGAHGLPLIGTGDWNDGLNRVGVSGRGESAWLGWFLAEIYGRFSAISADLGDTARSAELLDRRASLLAALEANTWDGEWYQRAFYDDGSPLGTAADSECRIDLNAQTWPALTGLADPQRAEQAMDSAANYLVDDEHRLVKLLDPPFDRTPRDPGYIKGYPPGVRENGGQYTHASTWAIWAAAKLHRTDQAMHWIDLLNPLLRVTDKAAADTYRGEPYVLAGDVYSVGPHSGRAGWTWYTGSAAWLYRIVLEQILGFKQVQGQLKLEPRVPDAWPRFEIDFRVGRSLYSIAVVDPSGIAKTGAVYECDGKRTTSVDLIDDGEDHQIVVSARVADESRATVEPAESTP